MDNLKILTTKELQIKWQEIFNVPAPKGYTKLFLIKEIEWHYKYGKLSDELKKRLDKLVEHYSETRTIDAKKIKKVEVTIGTKFIREFKGEKYEVIAIKGGFKFNGKKELLKDIENDKIDIVVVYKVDRLTRSLMDFSKIIDVFDRHETSFVSITQQFNTTTSMGRLTLNILLSFAQFEREVTGERIRDKIAASKKKGMWMGGKVPLGYIKEDKKLVIHKEDAKRVQMIFDKYLELKSVPKLMQYLKENEIKTKTDKYFSKGQLYHFLANKVYIGKITHKDKVYDGEHKAIICDETFEKVQKLLYENKVDKICGVI